MNKVKRQPDHGRKYLQIIYLIRGYIQNIERTHTAQCFPDSSVGKELACNAGDPGSIPGWIRSPGEGNGYPLPVFLGFPAGLAG